MQTFREACGRSFGLPMPRAFLEIGAFVRRTEPELLLKSRYVVPRRLVDAGFRFEFPTLVAALADLQRRA
jgi:hypothetical protein